MSHIEEIDEEIELIYKKSINPEPKDKERLKRLKDKRREVVEENIRNAKDFAAATGGVFPFEFPVEGMSEKFLSAGINLKQYTAIHLGLPCSSYPDLDRIIYKSKLLDVSTILVPFWVEFYNSSSKGIEAAVRDAKQLLKELGFKEN